MIYKAKAQYKEDTLREFYKKLTDGSILNQKPDGKSIVSSIERAAITSPGTIEWTEDCYCATPLKHERETVLDKYLDNIETELIKNHKDFKGESFMKHLIRLFEENKNQ